MPRPLPIRWVQHPQLTQLAATLERMGPQRALPASVARVIRTAPIGLGRTMTPIARQMLFVRTLSHRIAWSPALVERWRQVCGLTPSDFFLLRPRQCAWEEWSYTPCVCAHWRTAARRLLWTGGGLALETFAEPGLDARRLMFELYPPSAPTVLRAAFARTTTGPWAPAALALWALGPWEEAAIAQRRLLALPRAAWSPLVQEILVSATWGLSAPGAMGALVRRLPLPAQLRVVARRYEMESWAALNARILRAVGAVDPEDWDPEDFNDAVKTILEVAARYDDMPETPRQRVVTAARQLLPHFGPRSVVAVTNFLRTPESSYLPPRLLAGLLQHPEAQVRDLTRQILGATRAAGAP